MNAKFIFIAILFNTGGNEISRQWAQIENL